MKHLILSLFLSLLSLSTAHACGSNGKCQIGDRHYFIKMPDGHDGTKPVGALIFAHGFQGTGLGIYKNSRLRAMTNKLGLAFVAVKSKHASWSLKNSPSGANEIQDEELAYFDTVLADMSRRYPIDADKIIMAGSSTGGMVTWTLACHRSASFVAFLPMSGTFWRPVPPTCNGPVANIIHFHGTKDRTVPLEGRPIRDTHQGSVSGAFAMYRDYGGFSALKAKVYSSLDCKVSNNREGNILNFCLYDGGHSFRVPNIEVAWNMLRAAGQL